MKKLISVGLFVIILTAIVGCHRTAEIAKKQTAYHVALKIKTLFLEDYVITTDKILL